MTVAVDLYAVPAPDLESARQLLEEILGVAMELHDSSWRGGDYYLGFRFPNETFTLQRNRLNANEPAEEEHPDVDVILYAETAAPSSGIHEMLAAAGFRLLRHKEA
jgi:hypothetical protein